MSRLDSFIRRLEAQRRCLEAGLAAIAGIDGPVFELGLGNGRTYDHLREALGREALSEQGKRREIFVFERKLAAHPDCCPEEDHLFEGDLAATLPRALARFGGRVALIHADLGSGQPELDRVTSALLSRLVPDLLVPGGLCLSDQPLEGLTSTPLPEGVAPGRYHFYRGSP